MNIVPVDVGLDDHDQTIRVCVLVEDGKVMFNRDLSNDVRAVVREVRRAAGRAHRSVLWGGRLRHRSDRTHWLEGADGPSWRRQTNEPGPNKTDHGDAWLLADLERVDDVLEVWVPEVCMADKLTCQLRHLVRDREGIKAEQKNIKLRIRALLREERIVGPTHCAAWSKPWREWLRMVELGEHSRWVMDHLIEEWTRIETNIRSVEKRMTEATTDDADTQKLLALPGVGLITAVALRAEIGRFDRFQTSQCRACRRARRTLCQACLRACPATPPAASAANGCSS